MKGRLPQFAAIAIAAGLTLGEVTLHAQPAARTPRGVDDVPIFIQPHRAPAPPPIAAPPDVPSDARAVTPVTLRVATTTGSGAPEIVHRVTRLDDRVHIDTANQREWLYLRNPVDPRRVSAFQIDHAVKTIVAYDDSELRNAMGIRGWLDVLTLGFEADTLAQYQTTDGTKRAFDLTFERLTAASADAPVREVWWNRRQYLPLRLIRQPQGQPVPTLVTIRDLTTEVDHRMLVPPALRFPDYREIDYVDWLEGLHER